MNHGGAGTV